MDVRMCEFLCAAFSAGKIPSRILRDRLFIGMTTYGGSCMDE
jgi:hypothetical protein